MFLLTSSVRLHHCETYLMVQIGRYITQSNYTNFHDSCPSFSQSFSGWLYIPTYLRSIVQSKTTLGDS